MANSKFGAFVSESGAECLWGRNSQNDRLTPWFNDAISDPPGTAIYIRDDDIGVVWSPTAQPIREKDAYRARHGHGYTTFEHNSHAIEQQLLTFVPVDDSGGVPVRLQRLRLRNTSSRPRKLTITSYATLVLGSDPEETGHEMGFAEPEPVCTQLLQPGVLRMHHFCHFESNACFVHG